MAPQFIWGLHSDSTVPKILKCMFLKFGKSLIFNIIFLYNLQQSEHNIAFHLEIFPIQNEVFLNFWFVGEGCCFFSALHVAPKFKLLLSSYFQIFYCSLISSTSLFLQPSPSLFVLWAIEEILGGGWVTLFSLTHNLLISSHNVLSGSTWRTWHFGLVSQLNHLVLVRNMENKNK